MNEWIQMGWNVPKLCFHRFVLFLTSLFRLRFLNWNRNSERSPVHYILLLDVVSHLPGTARAVLPVSGGSRRSQRRSNCHLLSHLASQQESVQAAQLLPGLHDLGK